MKTLFICGSGRCGTTITKRALAGHPKLFSFEHESLFMEYPYGVVELFYQLTEGWTPLRSDTALRNFERFILGRRSRTLLMLYRKLVNFQSKRSAFSLISPPSYMSFDLRDHRAMVRTYFEEFKAELKAVNYAGCWPGMPGFIVKPEMNVSTIVDKQKVAKILHKFLVNVFEELMEDSQEVWLDDSIYLHLNADQILQFLPEAKFVHMYRDPRDVICSYTQKLWAPPSFVGAAQFYQSVMDRWEVIKKTLPADSFMEMRFEDLIANKEEAFTRLCAFGGVEYDEAILDFDLSKPNTGRWKKDLTEKDLEEINPYIEKQLINLGYTDV